MILQFPKNSVVFYQLISTFPKSIIHQILIENFFISDMVPTVAALTILSKFENDIKTVKQWL